MIITRTFGSRSLIFFFKNWPDCPYKIYLGTNFENCDYPNVTTVLSKEKTDWTSELYKILEQIPESHILLTLEDYFIYEPVDNDEIMRYFEIMQRTDAAFLRLAVFPKLFESFFPAKVCEPYDDVGEIEKGSKYRVNLQIAIWEKESLMELLSGSESPWEFELNGSLRSNTDDKKYLCVLSDEERKIVHGSIMYFCGAITQGRWMRDAIELCKDNDIDVDISHRPVETKMEERIRLWYTKTPLAFRPVFRFASNKIKLLQALTR